MFSVWKRRYKTCFPSKLLFSFATNKKNHMLTQDGPDFQKRWALRKIMPSLWKPSLSHTLQNGIQKKSNRYQNQAHMDSNACRESLQKGRMTTLKWDFLNYLCLMVSLVILDITCRVCLAASLSHHKLLVHVSGWVSICSGLMGWLLLTTPFPILPLLSFLGFKRGLATYAQNTWYKPCSELRALFNTIGQTLLPPN